jgi:DNA-directed RNA polymerase beta' subunit
MISLEDEISDLKSISFGVLSPEEITAMSCCQVTAVKTSDKGENIYSKLMGTIENGENCKTCNRDVWKCPGHFGHVKLEQPVVNPIFINDTVNILRCMCFSCYKFILSEDHIKLENITGKSCDIFNWVKNTASCFRCGSEKKALNVVNETIVDETKTPINVNHILKVLENIDDDTVRFLGFNPVMSHPKNYVFTVFPVMPPCCRPYVMVDESNCCDDDLTHQLVEIIKNNQYMGKEYLTKVENKKKKSMLQSVTVPTSAVYNKHKTNLTFRISTLFNNSKKKAKHAATARPITGIKERIAGKEGQIRNNLLGKRCNQSGRTVVGPDPTLKLDELIVPDEMAKILTIPEMVTPFNIEHLTRLANTDKINFLTRAQDPSRKVNVKNFVNYRGTMLYFGDVVERDGNQTTITDTKFKLMEGDSIIRNTIRLSKIEYPTTRKIELGIGDTVNRQLSDGDYVMLNRQPTLHKVSMMAMKVIVKPVKTLKINLAITKSFNCDFDGDEMNIHVPQSYEAIAEMKELSSPLKCIMSVQNGKPNMTIVQDSLVGLYYMSKDSWSKQTIEKNQFYDVLMSLTTSCSDYGKRMTRVEQVLKDQLEHPFSLFTGRGLLSFVFPYDFDYSNKKLNMTIVDGVFVEGVIEKTVIGDIIKIIYKSYGETEVSDFINNIHFATNKYLLEKGFTINAGDCLKKLNSTKETSPSSMAVKSTREVLNPFIKEHKIIGMLNSRSDKAMKMAKDALSPSNNFRAAEESGSKGSVFNICQITSMLGQQTIDGRRVCGLWHPQDDEFKNRGFIERSFVEGVTPREFMHHSIAGRKGVIDTALLTSVSGYGQRQGVKLNEDIKICSDYTVRDANGKLYRYIFGDVGYDPSQVVTVDGKQTICDIRRHVARTSKQFSKDKVWRHLTTEEIDDIVDFIKPRPHIPEAVEKSICDARKTPIVGQLKNVTICDEMVAPLKKYLETMYYKTLMTPGECVGILGAQSMGEFSTQATLNTFHVAGSNTTGAVTNCLTRFQEINNATKNCKNIICNIYFERCNGTIKDIRRISRRLMYLDFGKVVDSWTVLSTSSPREWWYSLFRRVYGTVVEEDAPSKKVAIRFVLKKELLYNCRLTMEEIKRVLEDNHDVLCVFSPLSEGVYLDVFFRSSDMSMQPQKTETLVSSVLFPTYISGVKGVTNVLYHKDDKLGVWYAQTDGGLLKDFYALDHMDLDNTTTTNIWDVYNTFGIETARDFRVKEMMDIVGNTGFDPSHITLRADRLTFTGTIQSLSRYTMRKEKPFSKVGFEEVMENFYKSSRDAEVDDLTGVSASIMCGKRPKVGTSMFDLKIDIDAVLKHERLEHCDYGEEFVDYES